VVARKLKEIAARHGIVQAGTIHVSQDKESGEVWPMNSLGVEDIAEVALIETAEPTKLWKFIVVVFLPVLNGLLKAPLSSRLEHLTVIGTGRPLIL
jgi:hypothetical protein